MLLSIKNLNFMYDKREILGKINLELHSGDLILVKGMNGSGKSTLLNLIAEFYWKNNINGKMDYDEFNINAQVSIIYQEIKDQILTFNVFEELATKMSFAHLPREDRIQSVRRIGEDFQMSKFFNKDPRNLSSGEQQKVIILANLIPVEGIVLLDEPFTYLDQSNIKLFIEFIEFIRSQGSGVIITTHQEYLDNTTHQLLQLSAKETPNKDLRSFLSVDHIDGVEIDWTLGYSTPLKNVKLMIPAKGLIAVTGGNGSGKTCLLLTIAGILRPIEGNPYKRENIFYLPQKVDYIFSTPTIREELNGIDIPEEMEKYLEHSPFSLSVGEKKYLSIYIILNKFDICLLDEPFQSLDFQYQNRLLDLFEENYEEKLIVFTTNKELNSINIDLEDDCIWRM